MFRRRNLDRVGPRAANLIVAENHLLKCKKYPQAEKCARRDYRYILPSL